MYPTRSPTSSNSPRRSGAGGACSRRSARFTERDIPPHLVLELEDVQRDLLRVEADLRRLRPGPADARPPYLGLATFPEASADLFFGRDALIADLVERAGRAPFLAVLGASGSGKSSVDRWEREQFKNRGRERGLDQRRIWVASLEDTLIAKMRWYVQGHGGSDQQWNDLQALIQEHRQRVKRDYLDYWSRELGIADVWDAVWRGRRPPPDEQTEQLRLF